MKRGDVFLAGLQPRSGGVAGSGAKRMAPEGWRLVKYGLVSGHAFRDMDNIEQRKGNRDETVDLPRKWAANLP